MQATEFGRSERLDPDQMALALDVDGDIARVRESCPGLEERLPETPSRRKPLPDHLPREDVRLDVDGQTCTCCGGALHAIGESVSEILDWETVPLGDDRASQPQRLKQDARFVGCSTGG